MCTLLTAGGLLVRGLTGSRCAQSADCGSQALERGLSHCDAQASLLLPGMWTLPGSGIEPVSRIGR